MRNPVYTNQFKKDLKKNLKRGKDQEKLKVVLDALIFGDRLGIRYRDHNLMGDYKGRRECHIEPDWLLIYKLIGDDIVFERTGTHSDLFD